MNSNVIERTKKYLFATVDEMRADHVPENVQQRLLRLRDLYAYWRQYPRLADKDIVAELRRRYKISVTLAYDDLRLIKICLGSLSELTTEYYRYYFLQRCEEGFEMARKNHDANAHARVLNAYLKGTKLDKDESDRPDYSVIVPQPITITIDPAAAGFKVQPNIMARAKKLEEKYIRQASIKDAEYEDMEDDIQPIKPIFGNQRR